MKKYLLLMSIFLIAILIVGCAPTELGEEPAETKEPIKIGFIGPMTGDAANIGINAIVGVELAVEEINAAGGINGRMIKVIAEDGECSSKQTTKVTNKLIDIDKVPVIIGGQCSAETLAAAPLVDGKTVLFSSCSSSPDVTTAGDYVFRDYPSDSFQGRYAAELAKELGYNKVASLYCLTDYCVAIKDVFKKRFEELGGEVVTEEAYEQLTKDMRTELIKIKDAEPELIYFTGYTEGIIVGLLQMEELGIDIPVLGGDAWDDPKIPMETGEAGEGAIYIVPNAPLTDEFKAAMLEKTGKPDVLACTPGAYDAAHIVADIMRRVGTDPAAIKDELYKVEGYEGVSGTVTIDENGDLASANYQVKILRDGKAVKYEEDME
ncbi:ABC transporter substrate-binding protein [Candidatus Woesearchaeota archaeon]|nr:ABC transporter substrate-binding protein [Candidatus Woesearchaeota archaeon]